MRCPDRCRRKRRARAIKGNSNMLMHGKNSDQIVEVIQKWLVAQKLVD